MPNNNSDPLESLLVDEIELESKTRRMLADILKPYASINKQTGKLNFGDTGELSHRHLILVLLCGRLAQKLLNKLPKEASEKLSQAEIIEDLKEKFGVSEGSVKSNLHRLRQDKLIGYINGKNYVDYQHLARIKKSLSSNTEGPNE